MILVSCSKKQTTSNTIVTTVCTTQEQPPKCIKELLEGKYAPKIKVKGKCEDNKCYYLLSEEQLYSITGYIDNIRVCLELTDKFANQIKDHNNNIESKQEVKQ